MKSKGADRLSRPGLGVGRSVGRGVQSSKRLVFLGGGGAIQPIQPKIMKLNLQVLNL